VIIGVHSHFDSCPNKSSSHADPKDGCLSPIGEGVGIVVVVLNQEVGLGEFFKVHGGLGSFVELFGFI
jgi:hypothetical protein